MAVLDFGQFIRTSSHMSFKPHLSLDLSGVCVKEKCLCLQ